MFLESLGDKPEAEAMWSNLASLAVDKNKLQVAERCYAALGDVARTHYLRETIKIADKYAKENGN
jgi:intraflagellar transport protein 172